MDSMRSTDSSSFSSSNHSSTSLVGGSDDEGDPLVTYVPSPLEQAIARTVDLYETFGDQLSDSTGLSPERMSVTESLALLGVGSSQYAAMVGVHLMSEIAGITAHAYSAEEVALTRDRAEQSALLLSHSGESTQTLAALRYLLMHRVRTVAVTHHISSLLVREADGFLSTREHLKGHCENSHAFSVQFVALYWLAHNYAYHRALCTHQALTSSLDQIRMAVDHTARVSVEYADQQANFAEQIYAADSIAVIGSGLEYPVALEVVRELTETARKNVTAYKSVAQALLHNPSLVVLLGGDHDEYEALDASGVKSIVMSNEVEKADVVLPRVTPLLNPLAISLTIVRCAQRVAVMRQAEVNNLPSSSEIQL